MYDPLLAAGRIYTVAYERLRSLCVQVKNGDIYAIASVQHVSLPARNILFKFLHGQCFMRSIIIRICPKYKFLQRV